MRLGTEIGGEHDANLFMCNMRPSPTEKNHCDTSCSSVIISSATRVWKVNHTPCIVLLCSPQKVVEGCAGITITQEFGMLSAELQTLRRAGVVGVLVRMLLQG